MKTLARKINEPDFVFKLLRAATVVVALVGTALTAQLLFDGAFVVGSNPALERPWSFAAGVLELAVTASTAVCCYAALWAFYRMCARLSKGSAFTGENAAAMRRIARLLGAAGAVSLGGLAAFLVMFGGVSALALLWPLGIIPAAMLGGGLLSHALCVLLRRAAALQEDADLTV